MISGLRKTTDEFPNAPTSKEQKINRSAPSFINVLLNTYTFESLRVFAEKYKGSNDELVAYIAVSLPAILTEKEEKAMREEQQANTNLVTESGQSVLSRNAEKIRFALEKFGGAMTKHKISDKTRMRKTNLGGPFRELKAKGIINIDETKRKHNVSLKKTSVSISDKKIQETME